jgi:hypothetical protein
MPRASESTLRWWSLAAVIALFGSILLGTQMQSRDLHPIHALVSILCIALLGHSWLTQRRYVRNRQELVFLTLVLSLPGLAAVWLGLNVIRFYSYNPDSPPSGYYWVIPSQDAVWWLGCAVASILVVWAMITFARSLVNKRQFPGSS